MIVVALCQDTSASGLSFFEAIAAKHQQGAAAYRLVTQPDHARLSGELAAAIDRDALPWVTDEITDAVATHDIGWVRVDGVAPNPILPPFESDGHVRSFLTTPPSVFLEAWTGSIIHAERIGPSAGAMVSQHFQRLAEFRLQRKQDGPADSALLNSFIAQESARQSHLQQSEAQFSEDRLRLLQLCDMVSLYVCCGLSGPMSLGIDLGRGAVEIESAGKKTVLKGVPLKRPVRAQCPAFAWRPGSPALVPEPIEVVIEPR